MTLIYGQCPRIDEKDRDICGRFLDADGNCPVHGSMWERCVKCQEEYLYPHLCRKHMLCGLCHPPVESKST